MKKNKDNSEDETKRDSCVYQAESVKLSPMFYPPTHTHTHPVINCHLVENNLLTVFLKPVYQLDGD